MYISRFGSDLCPALIPRPNPWVRRNSARVARRSSKTAPASRGVATGTETARKSGSPSCRIRRAGILLMTIPAKADGRLEPLPLIVHVLVYIAIGWLGVEIFGRILPWMGGYFWGSFAASFSTAVFANWFTLRIYTNRRLVELGLWWSRASADNLALGLIGGAGAALLVLGPPLLAGAAHLGSIPAAEQSSFGAVVFLTTGLIIAATAEELMMRGYAFQRSEERRVGK